MKDKVDTIKILKDRQTRLQIKKQSENKMNNFEQRKDVNTRYNEEILGYQKQRKPIDKNSGKWSNGGHKINENIIYCTT